MNITFHSIDPVNAQLTITVTKEDYQPQVTKALKDLRKTAVVPGFRMGYAPLSRLQAMYGKAVFAEEINKLISEKISDYINDNQLKIFGEPLPAKDQKGIQNFNLQEDFKFTVDLGLYPETKIRLTKEDRVPYYTVAITDGMIDAKIQLLTMEHGANEEVEEIATNDRVKGILVELNEDGSVKEGGIYKEDVILFPFMAKDQEEKDKFTGVKRDQTLIFNPYKMYGEYDLGLTTLLGIKKEEVEDHRGDFSFLVTGISRYLPAKLNQDLFDKLYKSGTITSEKALRDQIKIEFYLPWLWKSEMQLLYDVRQLLLKKASDMVLPEEFIKRWMQETGRNDKGKGIEEYYLEFLEDLKYHVIEDKLMREYHITIEEKEINQEAILLAREEIRKRGMPVTAELQQRFAVELLKNEDFVYSIKTRLKDVKLIDLWKKLVTLELKEISQEEFSQIISQRKVSESQE